MDGQVTRHQTSVSMYVRTNLHSGRMVSSYVAAIHSNIDNKSIQHITYEIIFDTTTVIVHRFDLYEVEHFYNIYLLHMILLKVNYT